MDDASRASQLPAGTGVMTQAPPAGPRRLQRAGEAGIAGLLVLLLFDLAIETFMTGAGARWVAAGGSMAGIAAATIIWRRYSAAAATWAAFLGLLTVLAVTGWMADGTTAGVVLLGQPTSRVLAAVAGAGVVLASLTLARLRWLPLPGKALVGLVALYALWALAWGIILRTPYSALLQGGSSWERLPFWLQGAFLGAIVIVPAGLLAHLLEARAALRGGWPGRWVKQATALVLVAAIAYTGIRIDGGRVGQGATEPVVVSTADAYRPLPVAAEVNPAQWPTTYEEAKSKLDRLMVMVRELNQVVDPSLVDVAARAALLGPDVDRSLEFVRDSVRTEPYVGLLRGARGTLVAGGGNPLDKSLLLAELLAAHGHRTRIATGPIDTGTVEKVIAARGAAQVEATAYDQKVTEALQKNGDSQLISRVKAAQARAGEASNWVASRSAADSAELQATLGDAAQWFKDEMDPLVRAGLRTHYWVQVQSDGAWIDLDPSLAGSARGQRLAEAASSFDPRRPPAEVVHAVRFTVTVERLREGEGQRDERVVLDTQIPTRDLVTQQVRIINEPIDVSNASNLGKGNRFRTSLQVGTRRISGQTYALDESAEKPAMPDIGSALFGGGESPSQGPGAGALTGLWLEVTLLDPGLPPRVERRYLVDRIGRQAREGAQGAEPAPFSPETLALLAIRNYDVVVLPAPYPDFMPGWLASQFVASNERVFRAALDLRFGRTSPAALASAGARGATFSPSLAALAAAVSARLREPAGPTHLVLQRPFVAMTKQAITGVTPGAPLSQVRTEEGFDIVSPGGAPFGGDVRSRAALGLAYGAFLTNAELAVAQQLAPGAAVANTSSLVERARARGERLAALRARGDEASLNVSANALAGVAADLRGGYAVLAPRTGDAEAGRPFAWWRVDPHSGVALGVSETGEGQGAVEKAGMAAAFGGMVWCQVKNFDKAEKDSERGVERLVVGQTLCVILGVMGIFLVLGPSVFLVVLAALLGVGGDLSELF